MGRRVITEDNAEEFMKNRKLTEAEEDAISEDQKYYEEAEKQGRVVRADFIDTPERMIDRMMQDMDLYLEMADIGETEAEDGDDKIVSMPPGRVMGARGLKQQSERMLAISSIFAERSPELESRCVGLSRDFESASSKFRSEGKFDLDYFNETMTKLRDDIIGFWKKESSGK